MWVRAIIIIIIIIYFISKSNKINAHGLILTHEQK